MTEFPEVGGTIGMFRDAILSISKFEQKDMALGAALAIGGVLTCNRFKMNGRAVRTPMYVMNIGETSSGKDAGIKFMLSLFSPVGLGLNKHFNLLGLSNYSSDVSMISTLPEQRTRIDYFEEFGEVFKGLAMKGDRKSSVGDALKKLFSATEYIKGHYTVTKGWQGECVYPAVNMLATIQPKTFQINATPELLHDGLLGRFIPFLENEDAKYLGNQRSGGISHVVLKAITDECLRIYPENPLDDLGPTGIASDKPHMCDFKREEIFLPPELDSYIGEVDEQHGADMKELKRDGQTAEMAAYGKVIENAEKIMKILCVGYGERTITRRHFDEAMQIVMASYERSKSLITGASKAREVRDADKIWEYLQKQPGGQCRRNEAMRHCHLTAKEMKPAVEELQSRGKVELITDPTKTKKTLYLCMVIDE